MTTGLETPSVTGDQEALQQAQKRGDSLAKWVQVIAAEHPHIEVALDHAVARRLFESLELRAVVYDRGRLHPEPASRRARRHEASHPTPPAAGTADAAPALPPGCSPVEGPPG